jgi:hypothetical protein
MRSSARGSSTGSRATGSGTSYKQIQHRPTGPAAHPANGAVAMNVN